MASNVGLFSSFQRLEPSKKSLSCFDVNSAVLTAITSLRVNTEEGK